jgi:hypothetical protein
MVIPPRGGCLDFIRDGCVCRISDFEVAGYLLCEGSYGHKLARERPWGGGRYG